MAVVENNPRRVREAKEAEVWARACLGVRSRKTNEGYDDAN